MIQPPRSITILTKPIHLSLDTIHFVYWKRKEQYRYKSIRRPNAHENRRIYYMDIQVSNESGNTKACCSCRDGVSPHYNIGPCASCIGCLNPTIWPPTSCCRRTHYRNITGYQISWRQHQNCFVIALCFSKRLVIHIMNLAWCRKVKRFYLIFLFQ